MLKRGLLNPIGTIFKPDFGLLNAEDGDKIYTAIDTLDRNQNTIHNELDKQMSLSKIIISRLNYCIIAFHDISEQLSNECNTNKCIKSIRK